MATDDELYELLLDIKDLLAEINRKLPEPPYPQTRICRRCGPGGCTPCPGVWR